LAPAIKSLENNVAEGFGVVILPDDPDHLEDVIVIRMEKSLVVNTKSEQALTLVTRRVMAVEDRNLHRSSKSLGFCDCEVIDQVGVQPAGFT
jgi:hypothetical protein